MRAIRPYFKAVKGEFSRNRERDGGIVDIMFCVADHFEPRVGGVFMETERRRVARWHRELPVIAQNHYDSDGHPPKFTWFFPLDEYFSEHLEVMSELIELGLGEVELHLHHSKDNPVDLMRKLQLAKKLYMMNGGMAREKNADPTVENIKFAFVHGNWALDNCSGGEWCGVDCELSVLKSAGCYADFTFPSAPHPTQPRMVNSIYWAKDDPEMPASHNTGVPVSVGDQNETDLMLITGPLRLNRKSRRFGIIPRIENGEISWHSPPSPERADSWVDCRIHVLGRPNWVFVKIYTHGAEDRNARMILDRKGAMNDLWSYMESRYTDGEKYRLHYVTAREMYNIIVAAIDGMNGNPADYRDYKLVSNADLIGDF